MTLIDANAGVNKGVVNGRVDDPSIIEAPPTPNTGLAIAVQVVSKSNPWPKVISIVDLVVGLRQGRIHVHRIGIELILITQSEIQGESRADAPVVLDEVVEIGGLHIKTENTKSLVEVAGVALAHAAR